MKKDIITAHKSSIYHREIILKSEICGCFHCLAIFKPYEIVDWVDDIGKEGEDLNEGQTALCPKCDIDSVVGSASGYSIDKKFLSQMQKHWFLKKNKTYKSQ